MLLHRAASQSTLAPARRPGSRCEVQEGADGERRALGALWAAVPSTGQNSGTPFFRLTPALGLCSLRENGYVLSGVDGTGVVGTRAS